MSFSDEDLKFCRKGGACLRLILSDRDKVKALFNRLECAEKFLEGYSDLKDDPTYEAWRKASGKAGDSRANEAGK